MKPPADYYKFEGDGPYATHEHLLFATILANATLDPELGFVLGAAELDVLYGLSTAMALHSPRGKGWYRLGEAVFYVIEAQRAGELTAEHVEAYYRARADLRDDGLPPAVAAEVLQQTPTTVQYDAYGRPWTELDAGDEVSDEEDQPTVEGGYTWHTDGRPPEPLA